MILNMTGGGGAGLNFKVVGGTTQPASPAENTIWVNTDAEITSHVFSATEPTSPVNGMVWFDIGTSCSAPINVLKKNTLMLYPTGCQQYIGGAWAAKEAKTYQDGAWVDWWNGELYDAGDEYTLRTGGWASFVPTQRDGTATKNADSLHLKAQYVYDQWYTIAFATVSKIDVTGFSTLHLNVEATSGANNGDTNARLGLCSVKNSTVYSSPIAYGTIPTATGETTLDISGYAGSYYVFFLASNRATSPDRKITVDKVWLT